MKKLLSIFSLCLAIASCSPSAEDIAKEIRKNDSLTKRIEVLTSSIESTRSRQSQGKISSTSSTGITLKEENFALSISNDSTEIVRIREILNH